MPEKKSPSSRLVSLISVVTVAAHCVLFYHTYQSDQKHTAYLSFSNALRRSLDPLRALSEAEFAAVCDTLARFTQQYPIAVPVRCEEFRSTDTRLAPLERAYFVSSRMAELEYAYQKPGTELQRWSTYLTLAFAVALGALSLIFPFHSIQNIL